MPAPIRLPPAAVDTEESELIAWSWESGQLAWKLHPYQLLVYETLWGLIEGLQRAEPSEDEYRVGTVVASRKIGKSFMETLIALEFGMRYPGSIIRITVPTEKEARKIFLPEFEKLLPECPAHIRPVMRGIDREWKFPNGSTITLGGCDHNPDGLRGPSSDLNFVDEAAYVKRLQYVVNSVLYPMTINTRGPTILCSTLNKSPNAEFNEYYKRCKQLGQAAVVSVHDAGFTPAQIAAEKNAVDQITWEVEYECKEGRDANETVVPEWTSEVAAKLTEPAPLSREHTNRPELAHWTRFTSADFGTVDNTVILTGYYDFLHATLHFTREKLARGAEVTARNIGGLIREMETADDADRPMHISCQRIRTGDNNVEMLQSIHIDQQLPIQGVSKLTLETMVNLFRFYVKQDKIRIDPSCVNLLACLEHAAWKEQASTRRDGPRVRVLARSNLVDAARQPLGHFDALMSAVYMVLTIDRQKNRNPLPATFVTAASENRFGTYHTERYSRPDMVAGIVPGGQNKGVPWLPANRRRR